MKSTTKCDGNPNHIHDADQIMSEMWGMLELIRDVLDSGPLDEKMRKILVKTLVAKLGKE